LQNQIFSICPIQISRVSQVIAERDPFEMPFTFSFNQILLYCEIKSMNLWHVLKR
jgi:hypothetical protein